MQCVTISPLPRDGAEIMRLGNVVSVMLTMKHYVPLFGTPLLCRRKKWYKQGAKDVKYQIEIVSYWKSIVAGKAEYVPLPTAGLHKLWYPGIRDRSTWGKFGAHGEHGDVFLFSNLGALWFSENLIRYSLHICFQEAKCNQELQCAFWIFILWFFGPP